MQPFPLRSFVFCSYDAIDFKFGDTISSASVAACTSATVYSGLISVISRPSGVTSSTHMFVMIRFTHPTAVSGIVQRYMIFGAPLTVCSIATMTRFAPITRSIAPPIPGTSLPGMIQFAMLPSASTCSAPSTVQSM